MTTLSVSTVMLIFLGSDGGASNVKHEKSCINCQIISKCSKGNKNVICCLLYSTLTFAKKNPNKKKKRKKKTLKIET